MIIETVVNVPAVDADRARVLADALVTDGRHGTGRIACRVGGVVRKLARRRAVTRKRNRTNVFALRTLDRRRLAIQRRAADEVRVHARGNHREPLGDTRTRVRKDTTMASIMRPLHGTMACTYPLLASSVHALWPTQMAAACVALSDASHHVETKLGYVPAGVPYEAYSIDTMFWLAGHASASEAPSATEPPIQLASEHCAWTLRFLAVSGHGSPNTLVTSCEHKEPSMPRCKPGAGLDTAVALPDARRRDNGLGRRRVTPARRLVVGRRAVRRKANVADGLALLTREHDSAAVGGRGLDDAGGETRRALGLDAERLESSRARVAKHTRETQCRQCTASHDQEANELVRSGHLARRLTDARLGENVLGCRCVAGAFKEVVGRAVRSKVDGRDARASGTRQLELRAFLDRGFDGVGANAVHLHAEMLVDVGTGVAKDSTENVCMSTVRGWWRETYSVVAARSHEAWPVQRLATVVSDVGAVHVPIR